MIWRAQRRYSERVARIIAPDHSISLYESAICARLGNRGAVALVALLVVFACSTQEKAYSTDGAFS
jgi:hypothetical protein